MPLLFVSGDSCSGVSFVVICITKLLYFPCRSESDVLGSSVSKGENYNSLMQVVLMCLETAEYIFARCLAIMLLRTMAVEGD